MSESLVTTLTARLDAAVLEKVGADAGASTDKVLTGFQTAIAAILVGAVNKVNDADGICEVFELLTAKSNASHGSMCEVNRNAAANSCVSSLLERSRRFLRTVLGANQRPVAEEIGNAADLPSHAVGQIMDMAAPIVLFHLGQRVKEEGLSMSAFPNWLFREADHVSKYLPGSIEKLLRPAPATFETVSTATSAAPSASSRKARRLLGGCLVAALLFGGFWLLRRSRADVATDDEAQRTSRARAAFPGLGEFVYVELPDGSRLAVPEHGMESKLIAGIQESLETRKADEWFDLDRVTFETNSAIPKPESEEQLTNLAAILSAFPRVRLKVGGYTDNSGNRRANQRLSENRAESVRRELVGLGIASNRLETEGYGDEHPIADNATEQGRAKNHRISLKILQR